MIANQTQFQRFLGQVDTQFIIPVYQRNYDWTASQCKQLLDDIIAAGVDNITSHFMGSIVYMHDNIFATSSTRELTIIDGQQRLTTLTLLHLVLYNLAKQQGDERGSSQIQKTYLINEFANDETKLKLKPTTNNDAAFKYLLKGDFSEDFPAYSRLIENYNFFSTHVTVDTFDTIQKGLRKLIFVEMSLERGKDDPQKIFESLNSTGLELSQSDLIRNYILMGLQPKLQSKIYENYWRPIELSATHPETNANRISDFIRDFLTMENREIPNKNKVYQAFKLKYPLHGDTNLEELLAKIRKFSYYYQRLINPQKEEDRSIRYQLNLVNKLEMNVAYPFLLEVYEDYATRVIDKEIFIKILELIQSFAWRRFIVGLPTNALNKIFMTLYQSIDKANYFNSLEKSLVKRTGMQRFPKGGEIKQYLQEKDLYNIQSKNRSYFLERLENFENREFVQIDNNPDITVEHIFPQNPDAKWKHILGEIEYKHIKENYLNTISNLTLSGNNGKLSNKYFAEKRDMNEDGKEQGYKFSRLWLNKHLSTLTKWDMEELEKRYQIIFERFEKIWVYPSVTIEDLMADESETNIFDADEPTFKKLDYALFFDQRLDIKNISDLYLHVLRSLFELNPEVFFSLEIKEKIGLTSQKETLREARPIGDTYFVEINHDSKNKFDRIKILLRAMDLTDELFIKYKK